MTAREAFIKEAKDGRAYDWLASYAYSLDREDLTTIAMEFAYARSENLSEEELIANLEERL